MVRSGCPCPISCRKSETGATYVRNVIAASGTRGRDHEGGRPRQVRNLESLGNGRRFAIMEERPRNRPSRSAWRLQAVGLSWNARLESIGHHLIASSIFQLETLPNAAVFISHKPDSAQPPIGGSIHDNGSVMARVTGTERFIP